MIMIHAIWHCHSWQKRGILWGGTYVCGGVPMSPVPSAGTGPRSTLTFSTVAPSLPSSFVAAPHPWSWRPGATGQSMCGQRGMYGGLDLRFSLLFPVLVPAGVGAIPRRVCVCGGGSFCGALGRSLCVLCSLCVYFVLLVCLMLLFFMRVCVLLVLWLG